MKKQIAGVWLLLTAALFFIVACGGGSDGGSSSSDRGTGTLAVNLVDATGSYQAVYVTIKEVQVCAAPVEGDGDGEDECDWQTVGEPNATYNLLELVNGVMAELGQQDLLAGTYNQMRLLLACPDDNPQLWLGHPFPNYLIDMDDEVHELKVPSGCQSGIKLVHPFEIAENMFTELILDFDVARSVVQAGNSGQYLLKPTIKVIGTQDYVIVSGTVASNEGPPIEGASVTVWQDVTSSSPVTSTVTDISGGYTLYLNPGEYTLVATAEGFSPACEALAFESGQTYGTTDFSLANAETEPVHIAVTGVLEPGSAAPVVKIHFSQILDCDAQPVEVAVFQFDTEILESGEFNYSTTEYQYISLPPGDYYVSAETDDGQLTWGPELYNLPITESLNIAF